MQSECKPGEEWIEKYFSPTLKTEMVQYDYRALDGELFTCIAPDLGTARARRDNWLENRIQFT